MEVVRIHQYSLPSIVPPATAHDILDALGMFPELGGVFDGANGLYYIIQGDEANAVISMMGIMPGGQIATGARLLTKGGKEAVELTSSLKKVDGIVEGSGKWMNGIKSTQEVISGTNIPKSFVMEGKYVNGKEIWVHGNATKHMGEYVNAAKGSILVENELMESFKTTVNDVLAKQLQSGKNFFTKINGWEIGIDSDTGVIYHALYK